MLKLNTLLAKKEGNRTVKMKANILFSFLVKILSVFINLILIPLTINYINAERYGVWLTISSLISWLNLLDIGFGNGLRNKFSEAIARDDVKLQKELIQSTTVALFFISTIILLFYSIFLLNFKWDSFLGVSPIYRTELQKLFNYLILLFSIQFILQIINPIFYALQKPSYVSFSLLLGNIFGLIGVLILKSFFQPSLLSLGLVIMSGNLLSLSIFCVYFFGFERRDIIVSFIKPNFVILKSIFSLGIKFFVVNVAYVVQYQSSNILISRFFSSEKVSEFNIAFKLFSIGSIVFGIVMTPVWSSVTDAFVRNDYQWISKIVNKLLLLWLFMCFSIIIILLASQDIYKIWIGPNVDIPFMVSLGVVIVICSNTFSSIFIQILNGLSVVNLQFWLSIITVISFVPLAYYFSVKLNMEVFGICVAIVISNINGIIVAPIQFIFIMNKMKKKFIQQKLWLQ